MTFILRFFAAFLLLLSTSSVARAAEGDVAAAEVLFQKGRSAMEAGDYEKACAQFEESQRLDPAAGTAMNLATCREKQGKLASAWETWQHALRMLEPADRRRDFVQKRVAELEVDLPRLTLVVDQGAPKGVTVFRDGTELGKVTWGQALPVDAGTHQVVVKAPGHADRSYSVDLQAGDFETLEVAAGVPLPDPPQGERARSGRTQKKLAVVAAGLGLGGIAAAVTTGLLLPQTRDEVADNCPDKNCNAEGIAAVRRGKTLLALNTAGWILGGVGLAAGVTLFVTAPSGNKAKDEAQGASHPGRSTTASLQFLGDGAAISYSGRF